MARKVKNNVSVTDENVVEPKPCKVFGYNEVLYDPVSIDYYRHFIKQLIRNNRLVGKIDDEGEYDIPEKIKRDLVKMEKEIADPNPAYYILVTVYMKKTFNFTLEVEEQEEGMASATLYLTESVVGHETVNFVKTFIASVILPYDAEFVPKIRKIFNMVDTISKIDDTGIPALAVLMQRYFDDDLVFEDIEELGSQIYIIRMLKILETSGPNGIKIINEYKKLASKVDTKKKGSYSKLRKELDMLIFQNGGFTVLDKLKEDLFKPLKEYNETIKKVEKSQENVGKIVGDGKKKADPTAEKKVDSGGAKSSGGGKSGSKPAAKKGNAKKGGKSGGGGGAKKKKGGAKKEKGKDDKNRTVDYKPDEFDVDKFLELILGANYGREDDDDDYEEEDDVDTGRAPRVVEPDEEGDEEDKGEDKTSLPPDDEEEDDGIPELDDSFALSDGNEDANKALEESPELRGSVEGKTEFNDESEIGDKEGAPTEEDVDEFGGASPEIPPVFHEEESEG